MWRIVVFNIKFLDGTIRYFTNLEGADLSFSILSESGIDFKGLNLNNANLSKCYARGVDLIKKMAMLENMHPLYVGFLSDIITLLKNNRERNLGDE